MVRGEYVENQKSEILFCTTTIIYLTSTVRLSRSLVCGRPARCGDAAADGGGGQQRVHLRGGAERHARHRKQLRRHAHGRHQRAGQHHGLRGAHDRGAAHQQPQRPGPLAGQVMLLLSCFVTINCNLIK